MTSRDVVSLVITSALALSILAAAQTPKPQNPQSKNLQTKIDPNLQAIADTERAFAALGAEKGVRESFMAYFAEDGIWLVPGPKRTVEDLKSRPAPSGPRTSKLEWAPLYGDVSRAGDIGYDTGPSRITDLTPENKPPRYGYFFSIWKKQPDGNWRVALDLGTQNPADVWDPAAPPSFTAAAPSGWKPKKAPQLEAERASLSAAEAAAARASQESGLGAATPAFLDRDARFLRNGISPLQGREAIRAYLAGHDSKARWESIETSVAKSADLGYSYGRYWAPAWGKDRAEETGYYVHVWRKDAQGQWKLVFHVTNPAPLDQK